jgi:hypothetical protein
MSDFYESTNNPTGLGELLQVEPEDSWSWKQLWEKIEKAYESVAAAASQAVKDALEAAKKLWIAAKEKAAALARRAKMAASALKGKLDELGRLLQKRAQALVSGARQMVQEMKAGLQEKWEELKNWPAGLLKLENYNLALTVTNPTAMDAAIDNLTVDIDYTPVSLAKEGGIHGSDESLNFGKVIIDGVPFKAYGASRVNLDGAVALDFGAIANHGLMGFLEDAATGKLEIGFKIEKLKLDFMRIDIDWVTEAVRRIFHFFWPRVQIPIDLPDDFKDKAGDAVEAYNYFSWQNHETLEAGAKHNMSQKVNGEGHLLQQEADKVAEGMERDMEECEEQSFRAAQEVKEASDKLAQLMPITNDDAAAATDELDGDAELEQMNATLEFKEKAAAGGELVDLFRSTSKDIASLFTNLLDGSGEESSVPEGASALQVSAMVASSGEITIEKHHKI